MVEPCLVERGWQELHGPGLALRWWPGWLKLADGDLLVMGPPTQRHWQHALPRRLRVHAPRLNLTFRVVRPAGAA